MSGGKIRLSYLSPEFQFAGVLENCLIGVTVLIPTFVLLSSTSLAFASKRVVVVQLVHSDK